MDQRRAADVDKYKYLTHRYAGLSFSRPRRCRRRRRRRRRLRRCLLPRSHRHPRPRLLRAAPPQLRLIKSTMFRVRHEHVLDAHRRVASRRRSRESGTRVASPDGLKRYKQ